MAQLLNIQANYTLMKGTRQSRNPGSIKIQEL